MAWECKSCQLQVELDDEACPSCGDSKAAWTLIPEKTTMVLGSLASKEMPKGPSTTCCVINSLGRALLPSVRAWSSVVMPNRSLATRGEVVTQVSQQGVHSNVLLHHGPVITTRSQNTKPTPPIPPVGCQHAVQSTYGM